MFYICNLLFCYLKDINIVSCLMLLQLIGIWILVYMVFGIYVTCLKCIHWVVELLNHKVYVQCWWKMIVLFQSSSFSLHAHLECMRIPVDLHSYQHLIWTEFLFLVKLFHMYINLILDLISFHWLMMLSLFSCILKPSANPILSNSCSSPLTFNWIVYIFVIDSWKYFIFLEINYFQL